VLQVQENELIHTYNPSETREMNNIMLSDNDLYNMTYGDHPDYKLVEGEEVVDTSRWSNIMMAVVQEKETGHFYQLTWESPATEYQECDPGFEMTQVYPKQVTKTVYTTKKED